MKTTTKTTKYICEAGSHRFTTTDPKVMRKHIEKHRRAGQRVPAGIEDYLCGES